MIKLLDFFLSPIHKIAALMFGRLSLCALSGGLVGVIVGFFIGTYLWLEPGPLIVPDLVLAAMILGMPAFGFVLALVGLWLRYGVATVFLPLLVNAFFTAWLTVWFNSEIQMPSLGAPAGLIVGVLVGSLLCYLCRRFGWGGKEMAHV